MDLVKITCYRTTKEMERADAIRFYQECVMMSEGAERNRYVNVLIGLLSGAKEVSDEYELF